MTTAPTRTTKTRPISAEEYNTQVQRLPPIVLPSTSVIFCAAFGATELERLINEVALPLTEAHLARYLDAHEHHWTCSRFNGKGGTEPGWIVIFSACHRGGTTLKLGEGPSRFHALVEAALAVHRALTE